MEGKIPDFNKNDLQLAVKVDGISSITIPGKNDEFVFENVKCNNGATAYWDNEKWGIFVSNLTKSNTVCTLHFKKKITLIDFITSLSSSTENLAYDQTTDNNLRYVGINPNNYVFFNNELWRIIGIMNNIMDSEGNKGSYIKLIRNDSIGTYSWDNKPSGTGSSVSSNGSNDWNDSTLMEVLNNGAYFNRTKGSCPNEKNGSTISCDFSETGLTDEAKQMIANVVWNLGGENTSEIQASEFYKIERGTNNYGEHKKIWTGQIGLIYPSDYGYAVGENVRENCLTKKLALYDYNNCAASNWLHQYNEYLLTITPRSGNAYQTFYVYNNGFVAFGDAFYPHPVRPTLFLNPNVVIYGDGDGSASNPYKIVLI